MPLKGRHPRPAMTGRHRRRGATWIEIAPREQRSTNCWPRQPGIARWDETWDRLFETPRPLQPFDDDAPRRGPVLRGGSRDHPAGFARSQTARWPASASCGRRSARRWPKLKLTPADAMVVCGGFHIFLDQDDPTPPPPIPGGHAERDGRAVFLLPHLRTVGLRSGKPHAALLRAVFRAPLGGRRAGSGGHRLRDRRAEGGAPARRDRLIRRRHRRHAARDDACPPARAAASRCSTIFTTP